MANEYRAIYRCRDGKCLSFTFESDHRIVRNGQINLMTNPLLYEVADLIRERKENPKNKMHQHGGYDKLVCIENVRTGTAQYYDIW